MKEKEFESIFQPLTDEEAEVKGLSLLKMVTVFERKEKQKGKFVTLVDLRRFVLEETLIDALKD